MKIPKSFVDALNRAYTSNYDLNRLFVEQKEFIMRLVHHALRYKPWELISDENDLFQEACIWIVHYMWQWDDELDISIEKYVVYNVGVRLQNIVVKERRKKRNPIIPPLQIRNYQYHDINEEGINIEKINQLTDNTTPEEIYIAKELYNTIDNLSENLKSFTECMFEEGGNVSEASKKFRYRNIDKVSKTMSNDALRQWLKRHYLPIIRTVLTKEEIITFDS